MNVTIFVIYEMKERGVNMIYVLIIAGIFSADWFIKNHIEKNKIFGKDEEILNDNIILTKHHNKGAMLNFMEQKPNSVMIVSGVIFGMILLMFGMLIPKKGNRVLKLGMSLILGGAMSNIVDRFTKGYVVDYFSFKWLKKVIFNISDIFIFIGSFLVTIASLFDKKA
jgi:lipoprotein signal peptidase